jgi:hypothetical protein
MEGIEEFYTFFKFEGYFRGFITFNNFSHEKQKPP